MKLDIRSTATLHCVHGWSFINGQYPYKLARSIRSRIWHGSRRWATSVSSPLSYSLVHPFIKRLKPRSSVNSSHTSFRLYFPVRGSVEISREEIYEISIEISIVVFLSQKTSQDQFMINEQWSCYLWHASSFLRAPFWNGSPPLSITIKRSIP